MVGKHLVIVIGSDEGGFQEVGSLFIPVADVEKGVLESRGDFGADSILPAAGGAFLSLSQSSQWSGFYVYTYEDCQPGDWFILDYYAEDEGDCTLVYENDLFGNPTRLYENTFVHVPSRDFDEDGVVNNFDISILGLNWQAICDDPNHCEGKDLDKSGLIDAADISLFGEYWMETTD